MVKNNENGEAEIYLRDAKKFFDLYKEAPKRERGPLLLSAVNNLQCACECGADPKKVKQLEGQMTKKDEELLQSYLYELRTRPDPSVEFHLD